MNFLARLYIAAVLGIQSVLVVFRVADDKNLAAGLGRKQHGAGNIAFGQHAQLRGGINIGAVQPGPAAVRGIEYFVKAAHQRIGGPHHAVLEHAEHFFR